MRVYIIPLCLLAFGCSPISGVFFGNVNIQNVLNGAVGAIESVKTVVNLASRAVDEFSFAYRGVHNISTKCTACIVFATALNAAMSTTKSHACLKGIFEKACKALGVENPTVCDAGVEEWNEEMYYVIMNLLLKPHHFCAYLVQHCGNKHNPFNSTWTVDLPPKQRKAGLVKQKSTLQRNTSWKPIKFVHIADIHLDEKYEEGKEVNCDYPQCCRGGVEGNGGIKQASGKWGSIGKCDIPMILLENLFQHLQKHKNEFDYIIWTGDLPPHDVYNQSRENQLHIYKRLVDKLVEYFPDKLILSALGNHESAPTDSFPPHSPKTPNQFSIDWLYYPLADHWMRLAPKAPDQHTVIRSMGSYVYKVYDGFKVISLNTNFCGTQNFWLYLDDVDPDHGLKWLIERLREAELAKDKVHIIGHIPPGDQNCLPTWSANYYKIINRFQDTITGQFFGHTHVDHYQVFYEDGDFTRKATNVAYIAPSVTTYDEFNPAFRIYHMDGNHAGATWKILDHETYYADIRQANQRDDVEWIKLYSAKKAYGLNDLSPESWSYLIKRALDDSALAKQMIQHYYRRTDINCDRNCTLDFLCYLRTGRAKDVNFCKDFPDGYKPKVQSPTDMISLVNIQHLMAPPLVPPQCTVRGKQRSLIQQSPMKQNCQSIADGCKLECGHICEGIVEVNPDLAEPERLEQCRVAVCDLASECCCNSQQSVPVTSVKGPAVEGQESVIKSQEADQENLGTN